jgi:hypothetical protein
MAPTDQKTKVVSPAEVPEDLPLPSDPKVIFLGGLFALAQYRLPPAALAAPSAEAAREVLRSARPIDLLLTDIIMPSSHGRDLAKEAERLRPGIRILYMTGYSRNAVVLKDAWTRVWISYRSQFRRPNWLCVFARR